MKNKVKLIGKYLFLFFLGAVIYMLMELIWRQRTHWTMGILGGICFIELGLINEIIPWDMQLSIQALIGTVLITINEFISGLIINVWLGWNVWDYSNLPFNIMGQICIPFCIIWIFVAIFAIILDDYIRYIFFDEKRPKYRIGNTVYYPFKTKK